MTGIVSIAAAPAPMGLGGKAAAELQEARRSLLAFNDKFAVLQPMFGGKNRNERIDAHMDVFRTSAIDLEAGLKYLRSGAEAFKTAAPDQADLAQKMLGQATEIEKSFQPALEALLNVTAKSPTRSPGPELYQQAKSLFMGAVRTGADQAFDAVQLVNALSSK